MSGPEQATLGFKSIKDNDIIKLPTYTSNDNTVCSRKKTANESRLTKSITTNEDACRLIRILEAPDDVNVNIQHKKQSIDVNIVHDQTIKYSEKDTTLHLRSNHEDDKTDVLYKKNTNYPMSRCNSKTKPDININVHKYKDHDYSDLSNNENVKNASHSQGMVNNNIIYNLQVSARDTKNMSVTNKNTTVSQVKNINDLKKVIPKVKILGAEVNTLKELTQANSNNKYNSIKNKMAGVRNSREKFNNYCRTCAGLKIPLVDIFSDKGVQMRLNQQMKHLENIDQDDSLSTHMCMDCICDLKMSYKFFMQIKKAEVKLKSIYASLNAPSSVRMMESQYNTEHDNKSKTLNKSENTWKCSRESNEPQSLSSNLISTNTEDNKDDNDNDHDHDNDDNDGDNDDDDDDGDHEYYDDDDEDDDDGMSKKFSVESTDDWEGEKHESDEDPGSIEEFDPDDHPFESVEYTDIVKPKTEIDKEDDKITESCSFNMEDTEIIDNTLEKNVKNESINEYDEDVDSCIEIEPERVMYDECLQSHTTIAKDTNKQPNILKRKASWHGKSTNVTNTPDSSAKEAKVHKLNTVNISPSDEEGIMYVTVKGSKPNELLLVKVKKMDKSIEKKDDKSSIKKLIDGKPVEKCLKALPLKDLYCDRSKKLENREAIIEEQIEQYKKKREKVLGGGTTCNTTGVINATGSATTVTANMRKTVVFDDSTIRFMNFSNNSTENWSLENAVSVKVESTSDSGEQKENIQTENELQIENNNESDTLENDKAHNSDDKSTKEYLTRLTIIKQKWEEAKMKKELLQKELDDSYTEGNIEKLSRILGEKEKNLQQFQEYLKQRKIVITRLRDEDIISLYEDCNIPIMHNKLPDLIDENPTLHNIGDVNFLDCDYCPQIFSTRGTLEEHLKSHDYKILYFCEDCGSEFPNNKTRRAHNITCLKKLICKYCDFMLESKGKKRQHEQKHCDTIYGQLCDVCGEKFKHQGTLDQHIKTQHMSWEKVFQCPKCPKKFAFKQKLSFHLKSVHTTLRAYLCEDCGADFKNPASLRHHRIRKHQPTSNKRECPVCHKLVPFYSLSKHMYTHKAYTIECPHCEKMFKNTSTLKQHVRIHEDQRQYRCDTCGVGFNRRDGLRLHMRVHQKSDSRALKECSCQICSEKFPNHSMLVIHRNRVHKDGRQYTCHICNRSMLSTRSLEWHMSHIHNETPTGIAPEDSEIAIEMKRVSCNHCDKTFKTEMILRTHIKNTHMEKNPVKCLDCDLMFTSEVRLRHHMMIVHNRLEGTLTCPHCPKRFVNQLRLKTHMISHSEERPYTCEICGFNLKTKIQLIKHHQNRHSDERPLQCRYCPWRCKQVSALVCHERTHTNERPYSCIVCKQRFKYLGDKNKHERRHESLGGSGFKRIVAGRNIKQPKSHEEDISASEHDLLEHDYENIDGHLTEQHIEYDMKYDEEQQIVKFGTQDIDDEEKCQTQKSEHEQHRRHHHHHHHHSNHQKLDEEDEDEEDEEGDEYEEEEDEEEEEEGDEEQQQQQEGGVAAIEDEEYKQIYQHEEYEEISGEASEAAQVIMNMEDATVYTEEVTADNIENAEMITAEMMTNEILQSGTVVHIQQQDDDGKIQMIPVMLSLPDLTDSATEINLAAGSIMYNN